jgi:MoaA/NifB/PqqE/SkfB family radical SAM enzyme
MVTIAKTVARRLPLPPLGALFEPTKVCNLQCDYCRRSEDGSVSHSKAENKHFTTDKFKEALSKLRYIRSANWIGDGEPLLNPDFNKLIEMTAAKGASTTFGTNGTLVTQKDVAFWKRHKVSEVSVSIDSPIAEKYEQMRKGAKFDRVIESCKMISAAGINLQLQIILFAESADDIPIFVDLADEVGARRIALPRPHLYDRLERYRSSYPDPAKVNKPLLVALSKMRQYGIRWYEPWYATTHFRQCMWPFVAPYIQINGTIQPCCFMSGNDKSDIYDGVEYKIPSSSYVMGNILTDDFDSIWHGDAYRELRRVLIESEKPVGTKIEPEQLRKLKDIRDGRFAHCYGCSWRWSVEC